jgi:MinD-like ATPase involved in chromosome partitioning or flagellar assembly
MIDLFKRAKSEVVRPSATSICVWGPIGSPGKTTFAVNLASELALAGHSVLLIDLDTYAPSIADYFGLTDHQPGLAAAMRLVGQARLDQSQIMRLSTSLDAGSGSLSVLCGLGSVSRWPEVTQEKTKALVEIAMGCFDFVVMDVASTLESSTRQIGGAVDRNSAALAALGVATKVVATFAADPVGVRRLVAGYENLATLAAEPLLVANKFRLTALGSNSKHQIEDAVMELCKREVAAFIPVDYESCDRALLESVPLAMMKRSSKARQAIAQFARLNFATQALSDSSRVAKLD